MGYVHWPMPRRNRKATDGGNAHTRGGGGWMVPKGRKKKGGAPRDDRAPADARLDALEDPAALGCRRPPPPSRVGPGRDSGVD